MADFGHAFGGGHGGKPVPHELQHRPGHLSRPGHRLTGASLRPAGNIPIKTIDFIDNRFYGNRMSHLQPLVTRRYADFGTQCRAICHPAGVAHR